MERLQKFMAHAGVASRRKSEEIITQGRVEVNGKIVTEMGTKIDPDRDEVKVDGKQITEEKKVYILLHKPTGYVTTVSDPRGRKTVIDLIDYIPQRVYPVGRLDYDSSGLLLLTNDGKLTYALTHPSHEVDKTYLVNVEGVMDNQDFNRLEKGIELEDGLTAPATVEPINKEEKQTEFKIIIHEGRNRQVRRMCKEIGYNVLSLKRIALADLTLGNLSAGEYRFLNNREIRELKRFKEGIE